MKQVDEVAKKLFRGETTDMVQAHTVAMEAWQIEPYHVTDKDIYDYFEEKGWPTWDSLRDDHLDTEERKLLHKAIKATRAYVDVIRGSDDGVALIMLAGAVAGDASRTGYGCGKTTLAQIVHYSTGYYTPPYSREDLRIAQESYFIESRDLMARFDMENVDPVPGHKTLVIDDVGREGTLRWEKRDPELQLQEKQDRYYTVIDRCYKKHRNLVITSNMSAKELAAFLGGAAWSRLLQMCPPQFRINMTGIRDMRPLLGEKMGENYGF